MPEPKRCSCCEKHTLRAQEEKKKLLNRLRRIEGQVRGLQAMVEADAYCNDVLTQSAAVNAAMEALPEDLRQAVTLREIEGLSYEEIATAMACPIGTVRSRIFRAREAISARVRPLLENRTGKRW